MSVTKARLNGAVLGVLSAMGLGFGLMPSQAKAATQFFDVNGATTGSGLTASSIYNWEDSNWSASGAGTSATTGWTEGNFPEFAAGSDASNTVSYSITANSNHTIAGMFLHFSTTTSPFSDGGKTVTLNGPGIFTISTGLQGFLISSSAQTLLINAAMTGPGGVEQESAGQLSLFGSNSYTGGTETTGGQTLNYNNANSFGTGSIQFTGTSGQGVVNAGAAGVTIPNNVSFGAGGTGSTTTNFASGSGAGGAPGAIWSGNFTLPTAGTTTIQDGTAGQVTEITGAIGGSTPIIITNPGIMIFAGANTYTGTTTVTQGTLKLGAANTIATSTSLILNGGTVNPDGINQAMSTTTLGLTASSVLDYVAGSSEVDFANSSGVAWTAGKILNLANWNPAIDKLRFGTDTTGLTGTQLAEIEANGDASTLGKAFLDPSGFVVVPEPTTTALLMGASLLLARRRRAC